MFSSWHPVCLCLASLLLAFSVLLENNMLGPSGLVVTTVWPEAVCSGPVLVWPPVGLRCAIQSGPFSCLPWHFAPAGLPLESPLHRLTFGQVNTRASQGLAWFISGLPYVWLSSWGVACLTEGGAVSGLLFVALPHSFPVEVFAAVDVAAGMGYCIL